MVGYHIVDEPRAGKFSRLVVNPFWPLLALMLGGAWIAWPWFVFNGVAMGTATKLREYALVAVAVLSSFILGLLIIALYPDAELEAEGWRWALVGLRVMKLAFAYWLFVLQERSIGLHRYFGGPVRNGVAILIAAVLLRPFVLKLVDSDLWVLVMA
ncbi:MAG: hypothetical protein AAGF12_22695 [Myxococcota bacterium]